MTGKVLTANLLRDGVVVFLTGDASWSEKIDDAVIADSEKDALALEEKGLVEVSANIVVDPYLIAAERVNGSIKAGHIRERIRTLGPTVRLDLGKQTGDSGGRFAPCDEKD